MPIEALTYKFCMLHRLERFGGIDIRKSIGEVACLIANSSVEVGYGFYAIS